MSLIILVIGYRAPADQGFDFVFEASGAKLKVNGQFDEGAFLQLSSALAKSIQERQPVPTAERVERVAQTLIGVVGGVACMAF